LKFHCFKKYLSLILLLMVLIISNDILASTKDIITSHIVFSDFYLIFFFSIFLILAIYHFFMFTNHIDDNVLLNFSLLNVAASFPYLFQYLNFDFSIVFFQFNSNHLGRFFQLIAILMIIVTINSIEHSINRIIKKVVIVLSIFALFFFLVIRPHLSEFNIAVLYIFEACLILIYSYFLFFRKKERQYFHKTIAVIYIVYMASYSLVNLAGINSLLVNSVLSFFQLVLHFSIIHYLMKIYMVNIEAELELQNTLAQKSEDVVKTNQKLNKLNLDLELIVEKRTEQYKVALSSVEATLRELEKVQSSIEHDLVMSSNVQRIYFSENIPRIRDWETAFIYRPLRKVSGDMYDLYVKDGRLIGASIFDVSGHGLQSALITMLAKNIISELFYKLYEKPAGYIMEIINKRLIKEIGSMDNYITGLLVKIDDTVLEVANASHANILHRSAKTGVVRQLESKNGNGNFLGISLMNDPYPTDKYTVDVEDSILLYTDGIYEYKQESAAIINNHKLLIEMYSKCRMYQSANSQLDYIMKGLGLHENEKILSDDLTAVMLKKLSSN
jgi:sigma-B regulation protein RsbU (phosphoserine phosphatase)